MTTFVEKGKQARGGTRDEIVERVRLCRRLLASGFRDNEVRHMIARQFGLSPNTVNSYIARGRKEMREETGLDTETLRAMSVEFYLSVVRDQTASHRDKIRAMTQHDKLLGLSMPFTYAHTTPDGKQSYKPADTSDLTKDQCVELKTLRNRIDGIYGGKVASLN